MLALAVPRLAHGFLGDSVRVRSLGTMLRLTGVVLWDIVVSNLTVARLGAGPAGRAAAGLGGACR